MTASVWDNRWRIALGQLAKIHAKRDRTRQASMAAVTHRRESGKPGWRARKAELARLRLEAMWGQVVKT